MKRAILVLLLLAACGPKDYEPSMQRARRETVDCPTGPALDRAGSAAFEASRLGKDAVHQVTCLPLYNQEPLHLYSGWIEGEAEAVVGVALTTPTGELKWNAVESLEPRALEQVVHFGFVAVDLDGDAHDELVEHAGNTNLDTWVTPYAISAGKATAGPRLMLATMECTATHEVINAPRGRHLVQVTYESGCAKPGIRTYGWDGQQLVEE